MSLSIFIGGTGSHAGKSWMAAAVCRFLKRRGYQVAPFKAQNMSLNSYPCREGGEIGRAQVAQAEACGLEPSADMNPILLKPNTDTESQVILLGKVWRNLPAHEYYLHFDFLLEQVLAAYGRLRAQYEFLVIEGAGSVSEINFRHVDLVNLGLARRLDAPGLLVADIDRGGVFASVAGTFAVLDQEERDVLRSFAVNRFRGDPALFGGGVRELENRAARKCLGVFPHLENVRLDEEDSVWFDRRAPRCGFGGDVAILQFPLCSNFTDFQLLPGAWWVDRPLGRQFRLVILPGSKNTLSDLAWMRARRLDDWVLRQHAGGARILGVCGGYQMLGEAIEDPHGIESDRGCAQGLGLLPVRTVLSPEKTTRVVEAQTPSGVRFSAYEIHMGVTARGHGFAPFAVVKDEPEGIRAGNCYGTYLHGALENPAVLEELRGASPPGEDPPVRDKDAAYDALADWFEQHADLRLFEELYL
ncbi:MAG: cobyric acid synthase [Acidobacteria bacterium]|nr:cobyric acid synthase [Acidobacteriota bacterium]